MKKLILMFVALVLLPAVTMANAGGVGSGGGKGVVCRDSKTGKIKSAQLLDLWEAKNIWKRPAKVSVASVDTQVISALLALKYVVNQEYNETQKPDGSFELGNDVFLDQLKQTAQFFLKPNSNVVWLKGEKLADTDDSFEAAVPSDCNGGAPEQIVDYIDSPHDPKILVNQDIWNALDATDRAALVVHEALYAYLRGGNETNSLRVRRAVGVVMSGQIFPEITQIIGDDYLMCASDLSDLSGYSLVYFYSTPAGYQALASSVFGAPMLGFAKPPDSNALAKGLASMIMDNDPSCGQAVSDQSHGNFSYGARLESWSPVDFDLNNTLVFVCENGKRMPYLGDRLTTWGGSGMAPLNSHKLNCWTNDQPH